MPNTPRGSATPRSEELATVPNDSLSTAVPTSATQGTESIPGSLKGPNGEQYQPREKHGWFWTTLAKGTSARALEQAFENRVTNAISSGSDSSREQSPAPAPRRP